MHGTVPDSLMHTQKKRNFLSTNLPFLTRLELLCHISLALTLFNLEYRSIKQVWGTDFEIRNLIKSVIHAIHWHSIQFKLNSSVIADAPL